LWFNSSKYRHRIKHTELTHRPSSLPLPGTVIQFRAHKFVAVFLKNVHDQLWFSLQKEHEDVVATLVLSERCENVTKQGLRKTTLSRESTYLWPRKDFWKYLLWSFTFQSLVFINLGVCKLLSLTHFQKISLILNVHAKYFGEQRGREFYGTSTQLLTTWYVLRGRTLWSLAGELRVVVCGLLTGCPHGRMAQHCTLSSADGHLLETGSAGTAGCSEAMGGIGMSGRICTIIFISIW
jgi:hypothetical protein